MKKLLSSILLILCAFSLHSATYYVAKTGDNGNPGTEASPWLTIGYACSTMAGGDSVLVKAGTYEEGPVYLLDAKSGSAGDYTYVSSYGADSVAVKYPVGSTNAMAVFTVKSDYTCINGFYIQGTLDLEGTCGIAMWNGGGEYCYFTNNHIYNNEHCGIKGMSHGEHDYHIEGNWIYDNGNDIFQDHGIYIPGYDNSVKAVIRNNRIFENRSYGIHIYPAPDSCIVENNFVYSNDFGGIYLGGSGHTICNNTLWHNGWNNGDPCGKGGIWLHGGGCRNNKIKNNIFYDNYYRQIYVCDIPESSVPIPLYNDIDYNLIWIKSNVWQQTQGHDPCNACEGDLYYQDPIQGLICIGTYCPVYPGAPNAPTLTWDGNFIDYYGVNVVVDDPLFVAPDSTINADFTLSAGSPAIDAGVYVGLPYSGSAPDMGAYEYDLPAVTRARVDGGIK